MHDVFSLQKPPKGKKRFKRNKKISRVDLSGLECARSSIFLFKIFVDA